MCDSSFVYVVHRVENLMLWRSFTRYREELAERRTHLARVVQRKIWVSDAGLDDTSTLSVCASLRVDPLASVAQTLAYVAFSVDIMVGAVGDLSRVELLASWGFAV